MKGKDSKPGYDCYHIAMKNLQFIQLFAALSLVFSSSPLPTFANPQLAKPKLAKPAKPKLGQSKAATPAEAAATYAEIDADITKQEVSKKKKHDQICLAAQADSNAGNFNAAEKKLLEAVDIAETLNNNEQKLLTRTLLAECFLKQKKYKEAEKQYKECYDSNLQLYRGNYPVLLDDAKGLSEVYKATNRAKDAEKILAAAKEARKTRYSVAGVDDGDLFASFYQSLREAIAANKGSSTPSNKESISSLGKMFQYPLSVRWNGALRKPSTRSYRNEKEFLANYKIIFTPAVSKLFVEYPEKDLWCKDEGIMLGGGLVWLTNVQLVKVAGKQTYQIHAMTINAEMPKN